MSLATLTVELQGNVSKLQADMAEMRNVVQMYMERIGVAANDASRHIEGVAMAGRQVARAKGADEAIEQMEHLNFSTVGARRELLVLGHEMLNGNWSRFGGSLMVLGERIDAMSLIFSKAGLAVLGVGAALAAFVVAAVKAHNEADALGRALDTTSHYVGMTSDSVRGLANHLDSSLAHYRDNIAMLTALADTGRFTGDAFTAAGRAATQMEQKTGMAAQDVLAAIAKIDDGAAKWAESMNKHYHFVTDAQYAYIRTLEEQGDKEKAEAVSLNLLADHFEHLSKKVGMAKEMILGWEIILGHAWQRISNIVNGKDIDARIADQLTKLSDMEKQIHYVQRLGQDPSRLKSALAAEYAELKRLSAQKTADDDKAAKQAANARREEGKIAADEWMRGFHEKFATNSQKRAKEIQEYTQRANALGFDDKQRAADIALINDKYKDKSAAGVDRANLDAQLRPLEDAIKAEDALLAQREAILRKYRDAGYLSINDYYKGVENALNEHIEKVSPAYQREMALVQDYAKQATDEATRINALTRARDLEAKMNAANVASLEKLNELVPEQAKDTQAYRLEVQKLAAELDKLKGNLSDNVLENFNRAHAKLKQQASVEGDTGTLAMLEQARQMTQAQADINEQRTKGKIILDQLAATEKDIGLNVQLGITNELQGMGQVADARRQAIAQLTEISDRMNDIAIGSGSPELLKAAQQFGEQVKQLQVNADGLAVKLQDAFGNQFATMLEGIVNRTKSLHSAVMQFANGITNMITQLAANALAKQLFGGLFGDGAAGGTGGFFSLLSGLFGGAMADGGDVSPGRFYQVNENGPELLTVANRTYLMTGAQSGHVTPISGSASGGRSTVMHLNITVPPGTTRQTAQQQAAEIMRHAQIASARNL